MVANMMKSVVISYEQEQWVIMMRRREDFNLSAFIRHKIDEEMQKQAEEEEKMTTGVI